MLWELESSHAQIMLIPTRSEQGAAAPLAFENFSAGYRGKGPWRKRLRQLLDTLIVLGKAECWKTAAGWGRLSTAQGDDS